MDLSIRNIEYCKGVGAKRADILRKELGVKSALDMLYQFPYKYIDRSRFYFIHEIEDDDTYVQIIGHITEWHTVGIGATQRLSATFTDGRHTIELVWFKGVKYVKLERNVQYLLFGKPSRFNHQYNFVHPELTPMTKVQPELMQGLEPHYNTTEAMKRAGLNSKAIRTIIAHLIPELQQQGMVDTLGMDIVEHYRLMRLSEALCNIHFPKDTPTMQKARERLKFEELFYIQMQILRQMKRREQNIGFAMPIVGKSFHAFYHNCLPFPLTNAQKRVVREIQSDLKSGKQMNRLLQGDVGSGKTIVALLTALLAVDNGYQACIMAPTEILARQHYASMLRFAEGLNVKIAILTGSSKAKERRASLEGIASGEVDILIGTHALIEEGVQFSNLGYVVIDEQHRFGVEQRGKLWTKNHQRPHVLVMTATPIPRTLAMTLYGDLEVSVIDELPPGRKPIRTYHYFDSARLRMFGFLRQEIAKHRQVYVVYPLIKGSEKMDYKDLEDGFESLSRDFPLPQYRIAVCHGKLKPEDKEAAMQQFKRGEADIMIATSVIEVGVDVPNATVMVIESAERFGLSQLHQLRGRVGRGGGDSYCILMTGDKLSKDSRARIEAMCATNDGFQLSELDLKLRGAGDIHGTQQSGDAFELNIANLATDTQIMELTRNDAIDILRSDPMLERRENVPLRVLRDRHHKREKIDFSDIS